MDVVADVVKPVYDEIFYQAAQGDIIHNDDTMMKVQALINNPAARQSDDQEEVTRTGIFTTGILSIKDGHKIALFFTGTNHAGENIADLLRQQYRREGFKTGYSPSGKCPVL